MIMNFSRKMNYQYNDHERIRSKFLKYITKIMITNDWSIIHYQDNGNEAFWGRLITGNDHNGHDHIHYGGSLRPDRPGGPGWPGWPGWPGSDRSDRSDRSERSG